MSHCCSVPHVPGDGYFPRTSARVIVIIAIVFAAVVLTWNKYQVPIALGAVSTTVLLTEEVARRLPWRQRPDTA
jgi:hypothetical protein